MIQKGNLLCVLDIMGCSLTVMSLWIIGQNRSVASRVMNQREKHCCTHFPVDLQSQICFQDLSLQQPDSWKNTKNMEKSDPQKPKQAAPRRAFRRSSS